MKRYITIATITTIVVLGTRPVQASGGSDVFQQIQDIVDKSANASVVLAMAVLGVVLGITVFAFMQK
ncbi:hypothetical protein VKI21_02285 [Cyanobacterium aponinum UTEX 3222]|uniref:Uncharacterized protein n=1 Tax=Cyanobacterium aponinum AL20115 TaxID=3090662 RepID=A0AAF0ZBZ9_9CHRO|nr:hypothetical protein [Cyanobacterium aponinum]WPF87508.1 hypothetical protein SAY89_11905 [Cyanobacterium aponinum AL20115]WRL42535.1 hypothetical protein VKI21_02285 [Cyanobacterium aponinum UTEX 3222]